MESLHCLCCFGNHSSNTRYFYLSVFVSPFLFHKYILKDSLFDPSITLFFRSVFFFPHHYLPLPSSSRATLFTCWVARLAVVMVTEGWLPCRPEVAVPRLSLCLSLPLFLVSSRLSRPFVPLLLTLFFLFSAAVSVFPFCNPWSSVTHHSARKDMNKAPQGFSCSS